MGAFGTFVGRSGGSISAPSGRMPAIVWTCYFGIFVCLSRLTSPSPDACYVPFALIAISAFLVHKRRGDKEKDVPRLVQGSAVTGKRRHLSVQLRMPYRPP